MANTLWSLVPEIIVFAPEVLCLVPMLLTASKVLLVMLLHLVEACIVVGRSNHLRHCLVLLRHKFVTLGLRKWSLVAK